MNDIAGIRKDYSLKALDEKDVATDPLKQFAAWWQEATDSDIPEVNAMTLCTVASDGKPNGRIVLLKGFTDQGFKFFTNYESQKGTELAITPFATLVFFWKELERQIRISGMVKHLPEAESDDYHNSRPRLSRLGAWASPQSTTIESRQLLESNFAEMEAAYKDQENIPRPNHWGGYMVTPDSIEFWQGRRSRLHDRILYTRAEETWKISRLAP